MPSRIITTNCLIVKNGRILLGLKKRGFGKGRWNGFGGKALPNETIESAAKREVREEAGIEISGRLKKAGLLEFRFQENSDVLVMHIFKAVRFSGQPKETVEMKPRWYSVNKLPFGKMWPDDKFWFPYFLEGIEFKGKFKFRKYTHILECKIEAVKQG